MLLKELHLLVLKVLRVSHQTEARTFVHIEQAPDHLLVTLRWIAFEAIYRPGFGRSEGDPVLRVLLKRAKELLTALHSGIVEFVSALELALECEFADELFLIASRSPDRHVGLGFDSFAEVPATERGPARPYPYRSVLRKLGS
jgi:hypothetical protein